MTRGIDTTANCMSHIMALKNAGYTFVCRYMSHSAWKNLTLAETQALSRANISIVSVWETQSDHASYFSMHQGLVDGAAAYAYARHVEQPHKAPIYFAADTDIAVSTQLTEYFQGVRHSLQQHGAIGIGTYEVGVYGGGTVCRILKEKGLVSYTWLAQAMGWLGSHGYTDWNLKQGPSTTFASMSVDTDESRGDGGGWQIHAA